MGNLYVYDSGSRISHNETQITIEIGEKTSSIPINQIDSILIFTHVNIDTKTIRRCIRAGIPMLWLSKTGKYFGKLISTTHVDIIKQRKQFHLGDDDFFRIEMGKRIIEAKIGNQIVVLQRYSRHVRHAVDQELGPMKNLLKKIISADSINQIMGYEGMVSKYYFKAISELAPNEFKFQGRSKRPPKDSFNSLISFGYTLLSNEIFTAIEAQGLNPFAGVIHSDKRNHPALVSDLIEEWRPVIIDNLVVHMIEEKKIDSTMFDVGDQGVFISKDCLKIFVHEYEMKMLKKSKYLEELDSRSDYRSLIMHQVESFTRAIISRDPSEYRPIRIR